MLEMLEKAHVVGAKQTRRAMADGRAVRLFAATDADPALVNPLIRQAEEAGIPVDRAATMAQLGKACGIAVGAAVAAVVTAGADAPKRGHDAPKTSVLAE